METRKPRRLGMMKGQQTSRIELQTTMPPEKALIALKQEKAETEIRIRYYQNRMNQIRKLIRYLEKECGHGK